MFGKIKSPGNYSDGQQRFEIDLYFDENEPFPFVINERVNYSLKLGEHQYICGVRSTEDAGSWISPDIYEIMDPAERLRLSEILIKNGFVNKEEVLILHDSEKKEIILKKKY